MTEKELKKLNRKQLLELLLKQTERASAFELELEEMKAKLNDKNIVQKEAGSIAEAALKLNGVFESAQAAADQYLQNISVLEEKYNKLLSELISEKEAFEAEKEAFNQEKNKFLSNQVIPLVDTSTSETDKNNNKKVSKKIKAPSKSPKAKKKKKR